MGLDRKHLHNSNYTFGNSNMHLGSRCNGQKRKKAVTQKLTDGKGSLQEKSSFINILNY